MMSKNVLVLKFISLRKDFYSRLNKGRTQCTRLPLYVGSGRGECRLALPQFMKRLLPSLDEECVKLLYVLVLKFCIVGEALGLKLDR